MAYCQQKISLRQEVRQVELRQSSSCYASSLCYQSGNLYPICCVRAFATALGQDALKTHWHSVRSGLLTDPRLYTQAISAVQFNNKGLYFCTQNPVMHSQKILTIQQGEPCNLSILSNPLRTIQEIQSWYINSPS